MSLKIKTQVFFILIAFFSLSSFSQEVILRTNFTVRDFKIVDSTLLYLEKRDIKSYNLTTKANDTVFKDKGLFIGGYGLRIFYSKPQKKIITASNELVRDISSIRFYDLIKKDINKYHILYETNLLDFYLESKDSTFVLSKKDSTIVVYKYGGVPRYKKVDSLKIDSFSRKIELKDQTLFYITDSGKLLGYNLKTKENKLYYEGKNLPVSFIFDKNRKKIYVSTFEGKIIKINALDPLQNKVYEFGTHIIETMDIYKDKYLIAGDWKGKIKIFDLETFDTVQTYNDKKRIVKIKAFKDCFYTSSSDKTIKKWSL